jgi:hypothetical protein
VIVFADTEDNETGAAGPDGRADQAYVIDKRTGQVVSTAHLDPATGSWVDADGRPVDAPTGTRRSMTVQTPAGDQQVPAEHDYTGDGRRGRLLGQRGQRDRRGRARRAGR